MPAIKTENLSKVYKLYNNKKDRLKESIHPMKKKYSRDFYALKEVTFEVQKGEVLGIIGKNGSGKSTLLTILTGLLTPSSGYFEVKGKVSALLELGAGFNPEYTGIENIYLNGTLLGFSQEEIDHKLEEIIEFANIGEFIDQPVKMYSSGMYIRLAFAIAISVDPDILIIDEALAVGDIRFQQKCYRKINELRDKNTTILFCTHDIGAVLNLCSSCIWLEQGQIEAYGDPETIADQYYAHMHYGKSIQDYKVQPEKDKASNHQTSTAVPWQSAADVPFFGEGGATISEVSFFHQESREPVKSLKGGEKVVIGIKAAASCTIEMPILGMVIKNSYGVNAYGTNTYQEKCKIRSMASGEEIEIFFAFTFPPLANGDYTIDVAIAEGTQVVHIQHCWKHDVITFRIDNVGEKYQFGYVYVKSEEMQISGDIIC